MFPYSHTFLAFQRGHCPCNTYLGLFLVMAFSVNHFHTGYLWEPPDPAQGGQSFALLVKRKGVVSCRLPSDIWPLYSLVMSHKLSLGHVSQCLFKGPLPSTEVIKNQSKKNPKPLPHAAKLGEPDRNKQYLSSIYTNVSTVCPDEALHSIRFYLSKGHMQWSLKGYCRAVDGECWCS